MDARMNGCTDRNMKIQPCILQDIGPLGPLPKEQIAKEKLEIKKKKVEELKNERLLALLM